VTHRPYVVVNMALTADGKIDTVDRRGARISGPADRARVDRLRAESDAVMVGGNTLLAEDPRLTVRDANLVRSRRASGKPDQPIKVGVVSRLGLPGTVHGLPQESRFLADGGGKVMVWTTARTMAPAIEWLKGSGADVAIHGTDRVDLAAALSELAGAGVERLMVEGGSTLVAALLQASLVDEMQLAIAPKLFGGESAPSPVGGSGLQPASGIDLELTEVSRSPDDDVVLRYLVRPQADRPTTGGDSQD
jgi:2,5-diamino-6-(ribosylamino)-4(3H)-pyrimidinone 5'-phosphate reductase